MSKLSRRKDKFNKVTEDKTQKKISFFLKKAPCDVGVSRLKACDDTKEPDVISCSKKPIETLLPFTDEASVITLDDDVNEIPPTPEPSLKEIKKAVISNFRRNVKSKLDVQADNSKSVITKRPSAHFPNQENKKAKLNSNTFQDKMGIKSDDFEVSKCSMALNNTAKFTVEASLFTKIISKSDNIAALPTEDNESLILNDLDFGNGDAVGNVFTYMMQPVSPKKESKLTPKKRAPNKPPLRQRTPTPNKNCKGLTNDNDLLKFLIPKKFTFDSKTDLPPDNIENCVISNICEPMQEAKLFEEDPVLKGNLDSPIANLSERPSEVNSMSDTSIDWGDDMSLDFQKFSPFKRKDVVPEAKSSKFHIQAINRTANCVDLTLKSSHDSYTRTCSLKGFWIDTTLKINDVVTVTSKFDSTGFTVIDNENGLFVLNPDLLVSSTAVASTMFCLRKSVLAEKFRGLDPGNEAMFIGNIIHELFQRASQSTPKSLSQLKVVLSAILKSNSYLHELYGLGLSLSAIKEKAKLYLPSIYGWINKYQSLGPSPLSRGSKDTSEEILVQVTDIQDIEENIWCTKYGVKGKIDLTVQVNIHKRNSKEKMTLPLELKTGKASFSSEHEGQVILYSLMLSEKLQDPGGGLLLYLSDGPQMKFVEATHNKKRGLLQLRNELAYYFNLLKQKNGVNSCQLPEPINRFKFCEKCPFLLPCSMMEGDSKPQENSSPRKELVNAATQHIQTNHMSFFIKWYDLLQLEYALQCKKDGGNVFWTKSGCEKEGLGSCLSNLKLTDTNAQKIGDRFNHVFYRNELPLVDVGISVGDSVVVSSISSPTEIGLSMGSISFVTANQVGVLLDKDLYKRENPHCELFRIDLNYSSSAFSTNFKNLLKLMQNNGDCEKLRNLIIDRVEPTFEKGLKWQLAEKLKPFLTVLNTLQQRAILKLLMAKDYLLLHGMPGTGKTSTIVALVRVLVALGLSVLLTSYTHSAVDNILLKLSNFEGKFVRLGQESRIHAAIRKYSSDSLTENLKTVEEIRSFYESIPVVATTCLGMNHSVFKQRHFDVCIVDEASQILQTACLGPLFNAKVFVLVGDAKQLPPIVNCKEAKEQGLCESLFSSLESPSCTFELNIQYRMNSEIMRLCNELTYDRKLQCGCEEIASATISLKVSNLPEREIWCEQILSEELSRSVVFLNTDNTCTSEVQESGTVLNMAEVDTIVYLIHKFVEAGLSAANLGVISFYKKQVQLLKQKCKNLNVEVNTVDQYQGRDKSVVMISCVRNSDGPAVSEIMQDERRLNVSLTRAKHKLVIVGSRRTMEKYKPFSSLINILRLDQFVDMSEGDLQIVRCWKNVIGHNN